MRVRRPDSLPSLAAPVGRGEPGAVDRRARRDVEELHAVSGAGPLTFRGSLSPVQERIDGLTDAEWKAFENALAER